MKGLLQLIGLACCLAAADLCAADTEQPDTWHSWITEMKTAEHGPFSRVLWFCNDGTTQPPVPDGCREHGVGLMREPGIPG